MICTRCPTEYDGRGRDGCPKCAAPGAQTAPLPRHVKSQPAKIEALRARSVDWGRVILALGRAGVHYTALADTLGLSDSCVLGYKNRNKEPYHWAGEVILALYNQHVGGDVPRKRRT